MQNGVYQFRLGKPQKKVKVNAGPLRKITFFEARKKNSEKNVATKLERGGGFPKSVLKTGLLNIKFYQHFSFDILLLKL